MIPIDEVLHTAREALVHCREAILERGLNGNPEFAEKWGLKLPLDRAEEAIADIDARLSCPELTPAMLDILPPPSRRDLWIYEQGRLAERDSRTGDKTLRAGTFPHPM
jgi:hypothetical protein